MKRGVDNPLFEMMGAAVLVCVSLLIGLGIWAGKSYFEARAFNHATGKSVSTWDAMFLDLRVQEGTKE